MNYPNKKLDTKKASTAKGGVDKGVESGDIQTFTFPCSPHPVVIQAKDIKEAEEKFKNITKVK